MQFGQLFWRRKMQSSVNQIWDFECLQLRIPRMHFAEHRTISSDHPSYLHTWNNNWKHPFWSICRPCKRVLTAIFRIPELEYEFHRNWTIFFRKKFSISEELHGFHLEFFCLEIIYYISTFHSISKVCYFFSMQIKILKGITWIFIYILQFICRLQDLVR